MVETVKIEKNPEETVTTLNKKYKIQTFSCVESDLDTLRVDMETEMMKRPDWKKEWLDDNLLKRFLCSFRTIEETQKKLCNYFNWRLEENIDNIDVENDTIMKEMIALGTNEILETFTDRCGRPIMIIHASRQRKEPNRSEYIYKRAIWHLEQMCAKCDQMTPLKNFTLVYNMNNFTTANSDHGFLQRYVQALRDYYPERIGSAVVINYPSIVSALWKVVKIWMPKHLRSRFVFCSKSEFDDFIDTTKMPVNLFE